MWLENFCMCMCGDDDDLDRILEGPVSDELHVHVVMMTASSLQQPGCLQNPLGVVQAPTNDAGRTAELPPQERRTGELRESGLCQGPCLSLADVLPLPHLCIISQAKNASILCTPTKIYTRKNEASLPFPPKRENLTPRKFVPLQYS